MADAEAKAARELGRARRETETLRAEHAAVLAKMASEFEQERSAMVSASSVEASDARAASAQQMHELQELLRASEARSAEMRAAAEAERGHLGVGHRPPFPCGPRDARGYE